MKVKNNAEAPRSEINWKHLFLVAMPAVVLFVSVLSDDFVVPVTPRALP